jgi:hypothetical protein
MGRVRGIALENFNSDRRLSGSVSKPYPICALTPGSAISERAIRGRLHMFTFGSRVNEDSAACTARAVTGDLCGGAAISPDPRSDMKELGEIDMAHRALATLELVTHDDAQPAFPALRLVDHGLSTATESWLQPRSASCSADQR